jgi:hypothetical protein
VLAVVDLAEVQQWSLHDTPTVHTSILDQAPIPMDLAIFAPLGASQKHAGTLSIPAPQRQGGWSSLQAVSSSHPVESFGNPAAVPLKKVEFTPESAKCG